MFNRQLGGRLMFLSLMKLHLICHRDLRMGSLCTNIRLLFRRQERFSFPRQLFLLFLFLIRFGGLRGDFLRLLSLWVIILHDVMVFHVVHIKG